MDGHHVPRYGGRVSQRRSRSGDGTGAGDGPRPSAAVVGGNERAVGSHSSRLQRPRLLAMVPDTWGRCGACRLR